MTPNSDWGGEGCIGCGIGYGYLHRIPVRPPSSNKPVPHSTTHINPPITTPIVNTETTNELAEVQLMVPSSPSYNESSVVQNGLETDIAQLAITTSSSHQSLNPLDVSSETNTSFSPGVTLTPQSKQVDPPMAYVPLIPTPPTSSFGVHNSSGLVPNTGSTTGNAGYLPTTSNIGVTSNAGYVPTTSSIRSLPTTSNAGYHLLTTSNVGYLPTTNNFPTTSNVAYLPTTTNVGYLPTTGNIGYLPTTGNIGYLPTTSNVEPLPTINLLSSAPPLISLGDTASSLTNTQ